MSGFLNQTAQSWFEWIAAASWQLAVLVVLLGVISLGFSRFPARFRHALWLLVLLKVFLPPGWGAPWAIGGLVPDFGKSDGGPATMAFYERINPGTVDPNQAAAGFAASQEVNRAPGSQLGAPDFSSSSSSSTESGAFYSSMHAFFRAVAPPRPVMQVLLGLWLTGVMIFAFGVGLRTVQMVRSLRTAERIEEGPLKVEIEGLGREIGLNRVPELLLSQTVLSPFLFGVFRPRIVLPSDLAAQLTKQEMRGVLMHELIHYKRGDLLVSWMQVLSQTLFWFHPFVWFANARLRHERECVCDELAVNRASCTRRDYAESLLKALMAARARSSASLGFLGIFERHTRLHERLDAIMNERIERVRLNPLRWGLVVLIAVFILPMAPRAQTAGGPKTADAPQAAAAPKGNAAETAVYIVAFKSKKSDPITIRQLLEAFNRNIPHGVRTHHYRTTNAGGVRIGYIGVDGQQGLDAVVKMLESSEDLTLIEQVAASPEYMKKLIAMPQDPDAGGGASQGGGKGARVAPVILKMVPAPGATDVDPALSEITVTFDVDMSSGFSWTGGGEIFPPTPPGKKAFWRDARTCVLPVALKPASYYRVGINSFPTYVSFQSAAGVPCPPAVIYFTTRGASEETRARAIPPKIVSMNPPNSATGVNPATSELRITFDRPMGGGFSWTGSGDHHPSSPPGKRPFWTEDKKTCVMPVELKPNWEYAAGINSQYYLNFSSESGVPVEPINYSFTTGPVAGAAVPGAPAPAPAAPVGKTNP